MGQALLRLAGEREDLRGRRRGVAQRSASAWSTASRNSRRASWPARRNSMSPSTSACPRASTAILALCVERGAALVSGHDRAERDAAQPRSPHAGRASRCCGRRTSASASRCWPTWSNAPRARCRAGIATSSKRTTARKLDAPSGTALTLGDAGGAGRRDAALRVAARRRHRRRTHRAVRRRRASASSSIHRATNRDIFARGALACRDAAGGPRAGRCTRSADLLD